MARPRSTRTPVARKAEPRVDNGDFSGTKSDFFALLGYTPHRGQMRIHRCTRRFIVAVCGRRWGKTLAAAREAEWHALQPGARVYVVAPYQHLCTRVFGRVWRDFVVKLKLPLVSRSRSEMRLEFPWDAVVEGRTAENPENLVGEGLTYVVFDEAAKARSGVWEQYLAPSLMDRQGRALFISTPEGMNWLYRLYLRGRKRSDRDWHSFSSPSSASPYLPRAELHLARRTLSGFAYAQEICAEFTRPSNLVYPAFSHARHVQPQSYDPRLPLYRALDFGYTNPFVCLTLQLAPGDRVRVLDEIYLRGRTIHELAELMKQSLKPYYDRFRAHWLNSARLGDIRRTAGSEQLTTALTHPLTGAPRFPQTLEQFQECVVHCCDPAGAGERAMLRDAGIFTVARSAPLAYGLELIRSALESSARLLIDPRCENLLREFTNYHYASSPPAVGYDLPATASEAPAKEDDHALDALRYFMVNICG